MRNINQPHKNIGSLSDLGHYEEYQQKGVKMIDFVVTKRVARTNVSKCI